MFCVKRKEAILDSPPLVGFFAQAGFSTAFTYLTTGVFLSGLAILMGAGDVLVSYLSVVINICGVLILGFSAFLERFKSRKRLTIGLTALSKLTTLFIVVIPAIASGGVRLVLFVPTVVAAFTLQAQTTVVLNQWMLGFMEEEKSGRYISLRQTMTLVVTVMLSLASGYWMDSVGGRYGGFVILFAAAGAMGAAELVLLSRIPDSRPYVPSGESCRLRDMVKLPLKNRGFAGFSLYIFAFYLLLNISDSFSMVYMIKYLALPYQAVTGMSLIMYLPQVVLLSIWGRISDRRGHDFVLRTSVWLFAGETVFLFFASPSSWFIFIPASYLMSSIANAGFAVAAFNRRYELMPRENRIAYDNFYTAAIGLGCILGPMIGGGIKGVLEANGIARTAMTFASIRLLYLISTAGILLVQAVYLYSQKRSGMGLSGKKRDIPECAGCR